MVLICLNRVFSSSIHTDFFGTRLASDIHVNIFVQGSIVSVSVHEQFTNSAQTVHEQFTKCAKAQTLTSEHKQQTLLLYRLICDRVLMTSRQAAAHPGGGVGLGGWGVQGSYQRVR